MIFVEEEGLLDLRQPGHFMMILMVVRRSWRKGEDACEGLMNMRDKL